VFETGDLPIPDDVKITALAAGLLAGAPGYRKRFASWPLVEDFDAAARQRDRRVVHASADARRSPSMSAPDGTPEITDFERFEDTGEAGSPSRPAKPSHRDLGGESALARTVFTTPELPEGAELFVIATGLLGKLPARSTASASSRSTGRDSGPHPAGPVVFALHGSPDRARGRHLRRLGGARR